MPTRRSRTVEPVEIRPPITVDVSLPPAALSLNGRMHRSKRAEIISDVKNGAAGRAMEITDPEQRPYFPASVVYIRVDVRIERYNKGLRRDFGGVVEALKAVLDGFERFIYPNDRAVYYGGPIRWDDTPTGDGRVYLTFTGKTIEEALAD